jgi:hypothetical protein
MGNPCVIHSFINCTTCMESLPEGVSPGEWARLNMGLTTSGIQVWCTRCDKEVVHFILDGTEPAMDLSPRCDTCGDEGCGKVH